MAKIVVPRWFIRDKALCRGTRLLTKPKFIPPPLVRPGIRISTSIPPGSGPWNGDITKPIPTVLRDMFDPSDFRFWQVVMNLNRQVWRCQCRQCGGIVLSNTMRRTHSDTLGCYDQLVEAYKLLQRDKRCVICDNVTTKQKWGVPLCSSTCIEKWCFDIVKPEALGAALELVKQRNLRVN